MVTSVALHNSAWMDGVQVNANDLRLQAVAGFLTGQSPSGSTGIATRPGVRYGSGSPLFSQPSSGMSITVNAGYVFVQGSASATAGMYTGCLDTTATLTLTTSDPTNPRIDNVIAQFVDNGNNTSTGTINVQAGTPAASPVAPTLPANSLLLAQINVGAGVTSITSGNITDKRTYTVATGGILPVSSTSGGIVGSSGQYAHNLSSGRLAVSDGSGNARQPKIGAFAATYQQINGNVATVTTSYTTLAQVTVTCDGSTEVEVFAQWVALQPAAGTAAGDYIDFGLVMDGVVNGFIFGNAAAFQIRADSGSSNSFGGGNIRNWITPAAGTHTFGLIAESAGHAFTVSQPFIRVAPSLQQ